MAEALQILQTMAVDEGKLDAELVRQFAASHCWEDGGQEATIVSLIEWKRQRLIGIKYSKSDVFSVENVALFVL